VGKTIPLDIVGGFEKEEFSEFNPSETINMFVVNSPTGKKQKAHYPTPGLSLPDGLDFSDAVSGGGRNAFVFDAHLFTVVGNSIFRITKTTTGLDKAFIGAINTDRGYVGIEELGNELMFVDGVNGWIYNKQTATFTQITSPDFPGQPIDVVVIGDRFVVLQGETKLFFYSAPNNGTSWNALNFYSFTSVSDTCVAAKILKNRMYVMGENSLRIWYNSGSSFGPYLPADPGYESGCAAIGSAVSAFDTLVWLSKTKQGVGSVMTTKGDEPIAISDQSIDTELQTYGDVSDANAYLYKNELGHLMYIINFTLANRSLMYDFNSRQWSKLEYKGNNRHLGQKHAYFKGTHYVLDFESPWLFAYSNKYLSDNGINTRRARICKIFSVPTGNHFTVNRITIELKQGTGDIGNDQDDDPQLFLSVSRDGGITYGNRLSAPIGRGGDRNLITSFYDLGTMRSMVLKIEHYNKTPFLILGATMHIDINPEGE
jgi:hypothetical protein